MTKEAHTYRCVHVQLHVGVAVFNLIGMPHDISNEKTCNREIGNVIVSRKCEMSIYNDRFVRAIRPRSLELQRQQPGGIGIPMRGNQHEE